MTIIIFFVCKNRLSSYWKSTGCIQSCLKNEKHHICYSDVQSNLTWVSDGSGRRFYFKNIRQPYRYLSNTIKTIPANCLLGSCNKIYQQMNEFIHSLNNWMNKCTVLRKSYTRFNFERTSSDMIIDTVDELKKASFHIKRWL